MKDEENEEKYEENSWSWKCRLIEMTQSVKWRNVEEIWSSMKRKAIVKMSEICSRNENEMAAENYLSGSVKAKKEELPQNIDRYKRAEGRENNGAENMRKQRNQKCGV